MARRLMRYIVAAALVVAALSLQACAVTSMVAPCDSPRVDAFPDVTVIVLPYEYVGDKRELSQGAADLASITQLQLMASGLKFDSFGITRLLPRAELDASCSPVEVEDKLFARRLIRRSIDGDEQDVLIWSGKLYEDNEGLYVQNNLRLIQATNHDTFVHRKFVDNRALTFSASVPRRSIAFPARKVDPELIAQWRKFLADATAVYDVPDSGGQLVTRLDLLNPIRLDVEREPQAKQPNRWIRMKIGKKVGWLQMPDATATKAQFPELHFVDGAVGYMQSFHRQLSWTADQTVIMDDARRAFARYRDADESPQAARPAAFAKFLEAYMELKHSQYSRQSRERAQHAVNLLEGVAKTLPADADIVTLGALARLVGCCDGRVSAQQLEQIEQPLLESVVLDSSNETAFTNLENFYSYLAATQPDASPGNAALAIKQNALRAYKTRALK